MIGYFSKIGEWGDVPSVEFSILYFVIALFVIIEMAVVLNTNITVAV